MNISSYPKLAQFCSHLEKLDPVLYSDPANRTDRSILDKFLNYLLKQDDSGVPLFEGPDSVVGRNPPSVTFPKNVCESFIPDMVKTIKEVQGMSGHDLLKVFHYSANDGNNDAKFFLFLDRIAMIRNKNLPDGTFKKAVDLVWAKLKQALELIKEGQHTRSILLNLRKAVYIFNELRWDAVKP